jgi:tetratricopeptide (TPR) repeat protein
MVRGIYVLGIKKEIEAFTYVDILALEALNGGLETSTKDSIIHYNKALDLMKTNSEDIAILELKRAINLNPHYNEALNLLGLLYAYTGEEEKAVDIFKGVISSEKNSIKALDYIGKIDGLAAATSLVFSETDNVTPKKNDLRKKQKVDPINKVNNTNVFENYIGSLKYHIIPYIVIFVLGAVVFSGSPKKSVVIQNSGNEEAITKLNTSIKDLSDKNKAITDENAKLKDQINSNNAEAEKAKYGQKLSEAESFSSSKNYEQAADLLLLLKDVGFNGVDKDKYTNLCNDIYPKASWKVYSDGINLFNAQDYKNAAQKLSKSISYGGVWDYTPDAYYNLGRSYQYLNDNQNAMNTYNALKEKFPNSDSAKYSEFRITELNK